MDLFKCTICGYIYDPIQGDPLGFIEPGTAFEDISNNWVCPICGASKSEFEPVD
jgi:rubredoxin